MNCTQQAAHAGVRQLHAESTLHCLVLSGLLWIFQVLFSIPWAMKLIKAQVALPIHANHAHVVRMVGTRDPWHSLAPQLQNTYPHEMCSCSIKFVSYDQFYEWNAEENWWTRPVISIQKWPEIGKIVGCALLWYPVKIARQWARDEYTPPNNYDISWKILGKFSAWSQAVDDEGSVQQVVLDASHLV